MDVAQEPRAGLGRSAHADTFCRDSLPPADQWPDLLFRLPELSYPDRLNCADALLAGPDGDRRCLVWPGGTWTYGQLREQVDAIAHVLVEDLGLVTGNRVLLRGPNAPWLVACWLAVVKAGGVAVATMPVLRPGELRSIGGITRPSFALCDARFVDDLAEGLPDLPDRPVRRRRPGGPRRPAPHAVPGRRDLGRRRRAARGDLGHHRRPEDHRALPPGRARGRRHVLRARAPADRGRPVPRQPAARVHLRARRRADLPAPGRRGHPADRAAGPGRDRRRGRRARGHGAVHRADRVPGHARGREGAGRPAPLRVRRRAAAARGLGRLPRGHRAADHRRHRLHRDAAHLHLGRRRRRPSRLDRPAGARVRGRGAGRGRRTRCRTGSPAGSRSAARPAAATWPTRASRRTCSTAGTSPATPTAATRTATSGTWPAATT